MMCKKRRAENRPERSRQSSQHSVLQKLVGALLCSCLIATLMPVEYYGTSAMVVHAQEILEEGVLPEEAEFYDAAVVESEADDAAAVEPEVDNIVTVEPEDEGAESIGLEELPDAAGSDEEAASEEEQPETVAPGEETELEEEHPETFDMAEETGPEEERPETFDMAEETGPEEERPETLDLAEEEGQEPADSEVSQEQGGFKISFYSGTSGDFVAPGEPEECEVDDEGNVTTPSLKEVIEGKSKWTAIGWVTNKSNDIIEQNAKVPVEGETMFYGVYERNISVSYEGIDDLPGTHSEVKPQNILVSDKEITYQQVEFDLRTVPAQNGYNLVAWSRIVDEEVHYYPVDVDKPNIYKFKESVTLNPVWEDNIPPELGEATCEPGYKTFLDWIIGKERLIITVPVKEEGSEIHEAWYVLIPEKGNSIKEYIDLSENDELEKNSVRVLRQGGEKLIRFTLDKEFKGKVRVGCNDKTDPIKNSSEILLTIDGRGNILIDNESPKIIFSVEDETELEDKEGIDVTVNDDVNDDEENKIFSGLADISYRIDKGEEVHLSSDIFNKEIVENYKFTVPITGAGKHTLQVSAVDNAGNERSTGQVTVNIKQKDPGTEDPENPGTNPGTDPGKDPGTNPGTDPGKNPGTDPGTDPGTNPGTDPGKNPGKNPGTEKPGNNPGTEKPGNNPGTEKPGNNPGTEKPGVNEPPKSQGSVGELPKAQATVVEYSKTGYPRTPSPKTGDFTQVEVIATLGMIAGFTYLLLYFQTDGVGMTEQKKDELVTRLIRWASEERGMRKYLAIVLLFFLLSYYHSIGKSRKRSRKKMGI